MDESKALEARKANLRNKYLGEDLVQALTEPTPEEIIQPRPIRGGGTVKYVPGPHFIRKLNNCFGFFWSMEYPQTFELNGQIVGRGRLTVHVPYMKKKTIKRYVEEGRSVEEESVEYEMLDIKKEQFGSSEIKKYAKTDQKHKAGDVIDLGDDYKGMGTDAMKKCATEFGIFLDVYESRASEEEGGITKQQLEVFYMRAQEAGMDKDQADKWGEQEVGKPIDKWDALDCMGLVPTLMDLADKKREDQEEPGDPNADYPSSSIEDNTK